MKKRGSCRSLAKQDQVWLALDGRAGVNSDNIELYLNSGTQENSEGLEVPQPSSFVS